MDRRTRTLVVVGVAVLMAFIATFLVGFMVRRVVSAPPAVAMEKVVVASKRVWIGAPLTKDDVQVVELPKDKLVNLDLNDIYRTVDEVVNKSFNDTLYAHDMIRKSRLSSDQPIEIPEGMRGMSVSVNEVVNVAGYVRAGTRVDVIVTDRTNRASRTILSNIAVLSTGTKDQQTTIRMRQEAEQKARAEHPDQAVPVDQKPVPSTVVTLTVTPEQATVLALAQNEGTIALALHREHEGDVADARGRIVRWDELLGPPPRNDAGPPQPKTIAVYSGATLTKQEVKR